MRHLSTLWSVRLLFLSEIISIIISIIATLFNANYVRYLLQHNILINIIKVMISIFIYYNLSTINRNLFKSSIFKILTILISFLSLILNEFFALQGDSGLTISNVKQFVVILLEIPCVYYLCKGFCTIVCESNKNSSLYIGWRRIGIANIVEHVILIIITLLSSLGISNSIYLLLLTFSLLCSVFLMFIHIFYLVYIYKTLLMIKERQGDGSPVLTK